MHHTWLYEDKPITEAPAGYIGFVYIITELSTGKMYVGKKLFWGKRGKKKVESDWRTYHGSSRSLHEAIAEKTEADYKRVILHLCKTKSEMSYMEIKEQIDRRVLFDDTYYNAFIGCKINAKGVAHLK